MSSSKKSFVFAKKAQIAKSSRYREFHPIPLTEPYVIVSNHTALIIQTYTKW